MSATFRKTRGKLTADRIVELYNSGLSTRAIALLHGTNRCSICSILRRRKHAISKKRRAGKFAKTERIKGKLSKADIVRLYTLTTSSASKIADADGTTLTAILRVLKQAGCKIKPANSFIKHGFRRRANELGIPAQTYLRFKALWKLGGKCVICGCSDYRVLQLNHIGTKDAPPTYKELLTIIKHGSKNHDVRCANCNLIYEFERGRRSYPDDLVTELQGKTKSLAETAEVRQFSSPSIVAKSAEAHKSEDLRALSATCA